MRSPANAGKSSAAGCVKADVNIGHMLGNGAEGVARDLAGSARAFLRAAKEGSATGALNYGTYCAYGKGCSVDGTAAVRWLRAAVASDHADASWSAMAYYDMGRILMMGIGGARTDLGEAERCLGAAADRGDAESAFTLVGLLLSGGPSGGGRKDKAAARKWANRAIELGMSASKVEDIFWAAQAPPHYRF